MVNPALDGRFDFNIEDVAKQISKRKAKLVLLQFPEGIKMNSSDIAVRLEALTEAKMIISGESCWGACDVDVAEAKAIGADVIVNFGHAEFFRPDFPVIYVHVKDNNDFMPLLKKSLPFLKQYRNIAIVSAIQHLHKVQDVRYFFEQYGKEIIVPKGLGHVSLAGHVVGCEYSGLKFIKKDFDAIVVIGNRFHALGAALALPQKSVVLIDTYNNSVSLMNELRDKIIRQRAIALSKFRQARKIGIIVGLKEGQQFGKPEIIKKKFETLGKQVSIITMREISPDKTFNFYDIDAFVELACPRIASDDYARYSKPIITFKEALVALGTSTWESLLENGFL